MLLQTVKFSPLKETFTNILASVTNSTRCFLDNRNFLPQGLKKTMIRISMLKQKKQESTVSQLFLLYINLQKRRSYCEENHLNKADGMKTAKKTTTKTEKHAPSSNTTTSSKKTIKEIDNENQCTSEKIASDILLYQYTTICSTHQLL